MQARRFVDVPVRSTAFSNSVAQAVDQAPAVVVVTVVAMPA